MSAFKYGTKRANSQTILEKRKQTERKNLESAAIIIANPDQFGSENSLAVRWARLFFANRGRKVAA
jgi:hypothetical protein